MVTSRPGTGKTTLIESFLVTMNMGRVNAARLAASNLDAEDMLRAVAYAYSHKLDSGEVQKIAEEIPVGVRGAPFIGSGGIHFERHLSYMAD